MTDFDESLDFAADPDPLSTPSEYLADQEGERLDQFLARRLPGLSRTRAQRMIQDGMARVDGALERPSYRLRFGEMVSVIPESAPEMAAEAEAIPIDVRYEDADVIVVNKQVGLTVHPTPGHSTGTLVNALLAHCPDLAPIGDAIRPGLVHRLDRNTSGVMVVAKNMAAMDAPAGADARADHGEALLRGDGGGARPGDGDN